MRTLPLTLAVVLSIAGAAAAEPPGPPEGQGPPGTGQTVIPPADYVHGDPSEVNVLDRPDLSLGQREDRLGADLDKSVADGSLGRDEYTRASAALADIRSTEDRLRRANHGELTDAQTFRLDGRIKDLSASVHWKR